MVKKIVTSAVLAASLLSVSANADSVHYGLQTGYAAGSIGTTSVNGPVIEFSFLAKYKKWRFQNNLGGIILNNVSNNSELGTANGSGTAFLGEYNIQVGYQVAHHVTAYGLLGVQGLSQGSGANNNNSGIMGFEWGAGASYQWMKYMSVYAQYTGSSLSAGVGPTLTSTIFTAGLQFHTGAF